MMTLFLLHGKTCVQFWHKDLRITASNSLSGHFENSGGRNWGEPKLLPAGVDLHPGHPDRNSYTFDTKDGKSFALVSCVYCGFF